MSANGTSVFGVSFLIAFDFKYAPKNWKNDGMPNRDTYWTDWLFNPL